MKIDKREVLDLIDSDYKKETLNVIEYIKNKEIPFRELSRDKVIRAALVWVLKYKGYTYMSNKLYNLFNKLEIDYKEVYETLINGNIIERRKTNVVSNIIDETVEFKGSKGINKSFYIRLNKDEYPFKIRYVSNTYKGFVECKFENRDLENFIDIKITIPKDVGYKINIEEWLVVYTDYKILFFKFKILKLEDVLKGSYSDVKILNTLKLMKERTRRIVSIEKGLMALEERFEWREVSKYIKEIRKKDVAIELFSLYKKTRDREVPIDSYIEILIEMIDIEEIDVKLGFLIENFLVETHLMKKELLKYLEKLYLDGYKSDLTKDVLEILKFSNIQLKIKRMFNIVDMETIEDFKKGNVSLEMANRILNTKGIVYDRELIKIMKDFYDETDDIKAIEKVILKGRKYKIEVNEGDIISLINRKKEGIKIKEKVIIRGGEKYKNKNQYIKNEIELIHLKKG